MLPAEACPEPVEWEAPPLEKLLDTLSPGRRRVAQCFVGLEPPFADGQPARTRRETAELLGRHVGTVHRTLGAIRVRHPEVYAALWAETKRQLAERHRQALKRDREHTQEWQEKQWEWCRIHGVRPPRLSHMTAVRTYVLKYKGTKQE